MKETTAPTKNLEEIPQTDPPVVAIAADPTPTPLHHPEVNQYVAPTPAVVATSAPTYPGQAEAPMSTGALVPLFQRVDAPTQYAVTADHPGPALASATTPAH